MIRQEKTTSSPKVSIGMPVYNGQRYIREALDSLLAQTFTDFELIISDNASSDETPAICSEYAARDSRIRYFRQSTNIGAYRNFLAVLTLATSSHFMWAAADDCWDAGWLTALVKRLDPGVSVVFGSVVSFDHKGRRITLRSLKGPRTLRMLRYYLWSEWSTKPDVIYGLYRTKDLRKVATDIIGEAHDNPFGLDNILVFTMLQIGCLRIEPSVTFYKASKPGVIGFQSKLHTTRLLTSNGLAAIAVYLSKPYLVPYLLEHVRRSPSGATRCAVLAATPIKYAWLVCQGLGPAAARFLSHVRAKRLPAGQG